MVSRVAGVVSRDNGGDGWHGVFPSLSLAVLGHGGTICGQVGLSCDGCSVGPNPSDLTQATCVSFSQRRETTCVCFFTVMGKLLTDLLTLCFWLYKENML